MIKGVVFALTSYAVFSFADAALKAAGGRLHVAEMTLIITIFSCVPVLFAKPRTEHWGDMMRMHRPALVMLRLAAALAAGLFSAYAFTTLPLADAYALIFLLPIFVVAFSFFYLGERTTPARLVGLFVGLVGVILVVKPGFQQLMLGHAAAIATAIAGTVSLLTLRVISRTERQVTLIGTLMIGSLALNGAITLFVYETPTMREVMLLALCGVLAGLGHLTMMAATRHAEANRIGPTQYSQIVWAVVLGGFFFDEYPDAISMGGIALVVLSGFLNFLGVRGPKTTRRSVTVEPVSAAAAAPRHPGS
ncbi:DMT family transporter [Kaistia geumhonensis]|uniref:Drug/metabolite transporter (DMT)-like permease n=1 Tax=Kaistia geumhonensis TaxID=410839 RepID=A0ABU0M1T5_9HYPH|nr:DMT family transporter [Kaistia geumhonensis]MCX5479870.1 DMT family transporter [Kaistia geumhonensis]MDQ0514904.1 drug/metabolite transporter (DMT)-like permease [Kaistia geumhonensis]